MVPKASLGNFALFCFDDVLNHGTVFQCLCISFFLMLPISFLSLSYYFISACSLSVAFLDTVCSQSSLRIPERVSTWASLPLQNNFPRYVLPRGLFLPFSGRMLVPGLRIDFSPYSPSTANGLTKTQGRVTAGYQGAG